MSILGDDITNDILGDDLNRNISENELPGSDDDMGNENDNNNDLDTPKIVEPKKRAVRNPRHNLKIETLKGSRGIHTIEKYFDGIKFRGKGYEKQDLNEIMRRLQHWGHRMFPTYSFDDVLSKIERLGKKKDLQVYMTRYRLGQLEGELIEKSNDIDSEEPAFLQNEPFDEFDALLDEQIAISKLAPKTPRSRTISMSSSVFNTPKLHEHNAAMSTPYPKHNDEFEVLALSLPETPVQMNQSEKKSPIKSPPRLSSEQLARIAENRRIAVERRKAKLAEAEKKKSNELSIIDEIQIAF